MVQDLVVGVPGSCLSDETCTYSVSANNSVVVSPGNLSLVMRNLVTGASISAIASLSGNTDLHTTAVFININFNSVQALFPGIDLIKSLICGNGTAIEIEAVAVDTSGALHTSCTTRVSCPSTEVIKAPCFTTQINMFAANTQQFFNCIGVDGEIDVQGILVHCGSIFGVGVCMDFVGATVHVGLIDKATGTFYEYASVVTQAAGTIFGPAGTFGVGFAVKNRVDVVALVPPAGSKAFEIAAFFLGDTANEPSLTVTIDVTISGAQADPCFLGAVLATTTYGSPIPNEMIHETITAHTVSGVTSLTDTANRLLTTTHDAIVGAGATPIDITVHHGPDVALFSFEGFGLITVPTITIVAHSQGSPVAVAVIILAIIAALIVLGIIVYFILQIARDILKLIPPPALGFGVIALGIVGIAGAGIAIYLLTRPSVRRLGGAAATRATRALR